MLLKIQDFVNTYRYVLQSAPIILSSQYELKVNQPFIKLSNQPTIAHLRSWHNASKTVIYLVLVKASNQNRNVYAVLTIIYRIQRPCIYTSSIQSKKGQRYSDHYYWNKSIEGKDKDKPCIDLNTLILYSHRQPK